MSQSNITDAQQILQQYWGYSTFRTPQDQIIEEILDGKDVLALMPTGGGKSICYQVPALLMEGVCLVISPLIALMKDQVFQLKQRNIVADAIYSGMGSKEIERIFNNCIFGQNKLLYLSPERLQSAYAIEKISQMNISLLAVDEAHCISQWGYDFRPPYLQIANFREIHPNTPVLALTATATPRVVEDIQEKLCFRKRNTIKISFQRKNLAYIIQHETDKKTRLIKVLQSIAGASVVYAPTRKLTKEIALYLQSRGLSADYYHAGLERNERSDKQDAWISGKTRVISATNAFGMGIDHPSVRTVIHMHLPESIEAYFQEAGRAGRDGDKAYALLMYEEKDIDQWKERFQNSWPDLVEIKGIYHALGSYFKVAIGAQPEESFDFELSIFTKLYDFAPAKILRALKILEENNYLYVSESIYLPSRLIFSCTQEEMYDYMLRNPQQGNIMQALLRVYQGVFEHQVSIDEYKLATHLQSNKSHVIDQLHQLHAAGLIQYSPTKDKPQIYFTQPREEARYLLIDKEKVERLRKWKEDQMNAMLHFVQDDHCRSMALLAYFGEKNALPCGICDTCIERKKNTQKRKRMDKIQKHILGNLTLFNGRTLDEWYKVFNGTDRKLAQLVVQEWSDEELLTLKDGKAYLDGERI
jgi:ATP-dependent DNA helicase RecQ